MIITFDDIYFPTPHFFGLAPTQGSGHAIFNAFTVGRCGIINAHRDCGWATSDIPIAPVIGSTKIIPQQLFLLLASIVRVGFRVLRTGDRRFHTLDLIYFSKTASRVSGRIFVRWGEMRRTVLPPKPREPCRKVARGVSKSCTNNIAKKVLERTRRGLFPENSLTFKSGHRTKMV